MISYGFQMTWVPIRGAVRALREAAKLEQRELARKSGLTERTIRLLESSRAPKTMYAAIVGVVQDSEALPARAAAVLGVAVGHGARFLVARNVARGVPFYATVFTRHLPHTRALVAAGEARQKALVVARVVVAQPLDDW